MNKEILEDKEINEKNIVEFKWRFPYGGVYHCCLCGIETYLGDSSSNQGDRLICSTCLHEKFKNVEEARKWMNRGQKNE